MKPEALKSKLILGTVQLGMNYGINNQSGKPSEEESFSILDLASRSGIRTLDTAEAYGDSQRVIGGFLRKNPDKKFRILSKFKMDSASINQQFENTSNELGVKAIDGYSFHRFEDLANPAAQSELSVLKAEGKISKVGTSVYTNDEFRRAIDSKLIELIQTPFNLLDNWSHRGELIRAAKSQGKEIHVRSVFLQGLFYREPSQLSPYFAPLAESLSEIRLLANENKIPVGALALRYALSFDEIDGVLIGVEKLSQLEENLKALELQVPEHLWSQVSGIKVQNPALLDPRNWK